MKKILLIICFVIFLYSFAKADIYGGWNDNTLNSLSNPIREDPNVVNIENNYKSNIFILLQKNKDIETELTVMELKLTRLEVPEFDYQLNSFNNLEQYMNLLVKVCPGAFVSSTFYDWRDVSKYRSVSGLHNGYDIALPAGSPVIAGWNGFVTSIAQWYGSEYGVTVTNKDGVSVTYGHISPDVRNGQDISIGTLLGFVVVDHVDIKMRDSQGAFIDFGASSQSSELIIKKKDNSRCINLIKSDKYLLCAQSSINNQYAYMEYLTKSALYYNLKKQKILKINFKLAEKCFKNIKLFSDGCIAKKNLDKSRTDFLETTLDRYKASGEYLSFKLKIMPEALSIIGEENKIAMENLKKSLSYTEQSKQERLLELNNLEKSNDYIKAFLSDFCAAGNLKEKSESTSKFPPLSLGLKQSKTVVAEKELKESEKILFDAREQYENARRLYSLGYISKKKMNELGDSYEKALSAYRTIQEKLLKL